MDIISELVNDVKYLTTVVETMQNDARTTDQFMPINTPFIDNDYIRVYRHGLSYKFDLKTLTVVEGNSGSSSWGNIVGDINQQPDLMILLGSKEPTIPVGDVGKMLVSFGGSSKGWVNWESVVGKEVPITFEGLGWAFKTEFNSGLYHMSYTDKIYLNKAGNYNGIIIDGRGYISIGIGLLEDPNFSLNTLGKVKFGDTMFGKDGLFENSVEVGYDPLGSHNFTNEFRTLGVRRRVSNKHHRLSFSISEVHNEGNLLARDEDSNGNLIGEQVYLFSADSHRGLGIGAATEHDESIRAQYVIRSDVRLTAPTAWLDTVKLGDVEIPAPARSGVYQLSVPEFGAASWTEPKPSGYNGIIRLKNNFRIIVENGLIKEAGNS